MHTTICIQGYTYIHAYMHEFIHKNKPPPIITSAASIWFEIWGVVDPGKKIRFSRKVSMFLGNFTKKIDFLGQISEKFRFLTDDFTKNCTFFKANFQRISIFRQFHKKIRFSEKKSPKFRFFQVISPKISIF